MGKPGKQGLKGALETVAQMREHGRVPHYIAKALHHGEAQTSGEDAEPIV